MSDRLHSLDSLPCIQQDRMHVSCGPTKLEFVFGDPDSAAFYASSEDVVAMRMEMLAFYHASCDDVAWCLQHGLFSPKKLKSHIMNQGTTIYRTLILLSFASAVYQTLPESTITTKVLFRPLLNTKLGELAFAARNDNDILKESDLVSEHLYQGTRGNKRGTALWLVAYFEGAYDIEMNLLSDAMAVSVADSIYFPERVSIANNVSSFFELMLNESTASLRPV